MSKAGQICWNASAAARLGSFRWYMKVISKDAFDDYTKVRIAIVDDENESEATSISDTKNDANMVSVYNTSGIRTKAVTRGLNIVKMSDGSIRKVYMKQ